MEQNRADKKKQSRVCMVTGAYYPQVSGGAIQCYYLLEAMPNKDRFMVIASYKTGLDIDEEAVPSQDMVGGIRIYRLKIGASNPVSKLFALADLVRIMVSSSGRIDILHIHGMSAKNIVIILLGKLLRKKMVIKMASLGQDDPESLRKRSRLGFMIYSTVDGFICTTPAFSKSYRNMNMPAKKMFEIPNGVDLTIFRKPTEAEKVKAKQALGIPHDSRVLLFVGFFSKDKGLDLYMDALRLIGATFLSKVYLIFIGSRNASEVEVNGAMVDNVAKTVEDLGLKGRSMFIDPTNDIEKYYTASDIFVFPSRREGMPNALLEAAASGLCVVSSRLKDITDYVIEDGRTGFLFDKNDAPAFAEKLRSAIGDIVLSSRLGSDASFDVSLRFDIKRVAESYDNMYERILGG